MEGRIALVLAIVLLVFWLKPRIEAYLKPEPKVVRKAKPKPKPKPGVRK